MSQESINAAKYDKIIDWSDGCSPQFQSRFVFRLFTKYMFDGVESSFNRKSHGKGLMDSVGETTKNVIFWRVKLCLFYYPYIFWISSVCFKIFAGNKIYLFRWKYVHEDPESTDQEAKPIVETPQIHKVERWR